VGVVALGCGGLSPRSPEPRIAEVRLLENAHQLTFEGKRAGEGYFGADGRQLVFQSEREPGNPFYQIYTMDLETGRVRRVSPGVGKTTCAWIHPDGRHVLFASTHDDPEVRAKQEQELEYRASGKRRPYAWDYDEQYELYTRDMDGERYTQLTNVRGYDAEASYSPDGQWIVFSSNRHAYTEEMSDERRARFVDDPSSMLDIYRMRADGSDVQRLTDAYGYDGGPFFSPDGQRIVWRRFSIDGASAEVYTMNADGTDVRQLTKLAFMAPASARGAGEGTGEIIQQGAMSWAPYFHPSGRYVIFSTNLHGFTNFELYMVAADAPRPVEYTLPAPGQTPAPLPRGLVRVTANEADFDGLPVFTPDGKHLAWTLRKGKNRRRGRGTMPIGRWIDCALCDSSLRPPFIANPVPVPASASLPAPARPGPGRCNPPGRAAGTTRSRCIPRR